MQISYELLQKRILERNFAPIFFLAGDESYFIDEITSLIEKEVLTDDQKSFNQTILYGKDCKAEDIISACMKFPLMSDIQLVIVKEAQNVSKIEKLANYLQNPNPSTLLCISHKKKLDSRTKFSKDVINAQNVLFLESKPLSETESGKLVIKLFSQQNIKIDTGAANQIVYLLDNQLDRIKQSLNLIAINASNPQHITIKDVEKQLTSDKSFDVFALQKAVGERNFKKVAEMNTYFVPNIKEHIFSLSSNFFKYFSTALIVGAQPDKQANVLHNTFFAKEYQSVYNNYGNKLFDILTYIEEFDKKCKGIGANAQIADEHYQELIYKIMLL